MVHMVCCPAVALLHCLLLPPLGAPSSPIGGANYCSEHLCMSLCLSVCSCVSKPRSNFFLYMLSVARSWFDDSRIRYVLPVLWMMMMSCFPIMLSVACCIGNVSVSAVLEQVVISFQRIRQRAWHCLSLLSYIMAADCAPGTLATSTSGGAVICW